MRNTVVPGVLSLTCRRCMGAPSIAVVSRWVGCRTARRHPDRSAQPIPCHPDRSAQITITVIPTGGGVLCRRSGGTPRISLLLVLVLRFCLFLPLFVLAVILSASFEREGSRYRSRLPQPSTPFSPQVPPLPCSEGAGGLHGCGKNPVFVFRREQGASAP